MSAPEVITLGCRLNIAESDALAASLAGADDNIVIVNSCAVTNEAVRQTRQAVRRAKRARPDARVVVTGCAAQVDPAMFAAMPEVAGVVGNSEKAEPARFLGFDRANDKVRVADIMDVREQAPQLATSFSDRARAFVEVQNGCDHRCTFCIIPYGRGASRSVPAGALVEKIRALVDEGFSEVVLTGVDVTSYGADLPGRQNLGSLVERILNGVPTLQRLRLSSLDGIEIDDRLFELLTANERVMPHVHLSLQAGDDLILKRMKRRHSREQAVELVARLHEARPDIAIGADIIAGFPTEDEAMFERSLALIEDCRIVHGHIFPYSPKQGTPAARMPQVDGTAIKARAAKLRAAATTKRNAWLDEQIGSIQRVLVERDGVSGHAENFAMLRWAEPQPAGALVDIRVAGREGAKLVGDVMTKAPAHGL